MRTIWMNVESKHRFQDWHITMIIFSSVLVKYTEVLSKILKKISIMYDEEYCYEEHIIIKNVAIQWLPE